MGERFMAMLALERTDTVPGQALIDQIKQQFPQLKAPVTLLPQTKAADGTVLPLLIRVDRTVVTVMWVDQPIPSDSLDRAIAADQVWPEAKMRLAGHKAHVIVGTVTGAKDWQAAVDGAVSVTLVTAALAALLPSIGVYWSTGMMVTESARFQAEAGKMLSGQPPIDVWMQFQWLEGPPTAAGEKTHGLFSTGLRPFFGREVEFEPSALPPLTIGERVFGMIGYLLAKGPVIKDGELIGATITEKIRVRHVSSGWRKAVPALKLTVEEVESPMQPSSAGEAS